MDNEKFQELVLSQFGEMNKQFEKIDQRFEKIDQRFEKIDQRFDGIESQLKENTQILKALEHVAEVNKAEHDKMNFAIANIEKGLSKLADVTAKNCFDLTYLKQA